MSTDSCCKMDESWKHVVWFNLYEISGRYQCIDIGSRLVGVRGWVMKE